jgi:hypothetical protein
MVVVFGGRLQFGKMRIVLSRQEKIDGIDIRP